VLSFWFWLNGKTGGSRPARRPTFCPGVNKKKAKNGYSCRRGSVVPPTVSAGEHRRCNLARKQLPWMLPSVSLSPQQWVTLGHWINFSEVDNQIAQISCMAP
jgi:hypothetical protein